MIRENNCHCFFVNILLKYPALTIFMSTLGLVKVGNRKADPPADIALAGLK